MSLMQAQAKASGQTISTDQTDLSDTDLSKLYAMEALIKAMPTQVLEQAQQAAAKTDSSIGSQMGIAVSYTHLDVYKRQGCHRPFFSACRAVSL